MYCPEYFKESEFVRVGCKMSDMNDRLLMMLDYMRRLYGLPITITSAYRTSAANKAAGGAKNSAHLRGLAVDVACLSIYRFDMVKAALLAGFPRIGIGSNFLHLDIDLTLTHPRMWLY